MNLRTVEVSDMGEFDWWRDSWDDLVEKGAVGDLFQSYDWLVPWLRAFWRDRPLVFLFVVRGETLEGLVPLLREDDDKHGDAPVFSTPINPHVRRQGILARKDCVPVLTEALRHLRINHPRARVELRRFRGDGPVAPLIPAIAKSTGWLTISDSETESALATLKGDWEGYERSLKKKARSEMRRKARKLREEDGWGFVCHQGEVDWASVFDAILKVEDQSWKHESGTSITLDPGALEFYDDLMRLNSRKDRLVVHVLKRNGEPVAHLLGLTHRGTFLALKTSYSREYSSWSPGAAVMWRALQFAAESGVDTFDFLGDSDGWKEDLSSVSIPHVTYVLYPSNRIRGHLVRAVESGLKPALRRVGLMNVLKKTVGRLRPGPEASPRE